MDTSGQTIDSLLAAKRDTAAALRFFRKAIRHHGEPEVASKLNYLWRSCTGELSKQNDLFRLTYALETAKDMHWNYRLLSDWEWSGRYTVALNAEDNAIYLSHSNLNMAFDDDGWLVNPLMARLSGRVANLEELLNHCGWQAETVSDISLPHQYVLTVRQGV